jgi:acyl-CoA dehydrogenase
VTAIQQTSTIADRATLVGETFAGPVAAEVDRDARFPTEALEGMREQGLLSVLVPTELGGPGAPMSEVATAVTALSRHCASTAMIYAMHQIQVACVVRHGHTLRTTRCWFSAHLPD